MLIWGRLTPILHLRGAGHSRTLAGPLPSSVPARQIQVKLGVAVVCVGSTHTTNGCRHLAVIPANMLHEALGYRPRSRLLPSPPSLAASLPLPTYHLHPRLCQQDQERYEVVYPTVVIKQNGCASNTGLCGDCIAGCQRVPLPYGWWCQTCAHKNSQRNTESLFWPGKWTTHHTSADQLQCCETCCSETLDWDAGRCVCGGAGGGDCSKMDLIQMPRGDRAASDRGVYSTDEV